MKILLLGAGSVVHTQRWANGLTRASVDVVCMSLHPFLDVGWESRVERVRLPHRGIGGYFLNAATVRRTFFERGCDLLNAHYATGYGMLATISGVRPRLISVWGSDVYDFPVKSPVHRALVRSVLRSADGIASTSLVMAEQVRRVMPKGWQGSIDLTPFGVDMQLFTPATEVLSDTRPLVIGTVKTLAHKYGIDTLIRAYALLVSDRVLTAELPDGMVLRLVGGGEQRAALESLVCSLGLQDQVEFIGAVPHAEVPQWLRGFDIYVAASRLDSESFGVAVIEASACELPVVVTRVGGLPEVVVDSETGFIVERDDPQALAIALRCLVLNPYLRGQLGRRGRAHVARTYEWRECVDRMTETYVATRVRSGHAQEGAQCHD